MTRPEIEALIAWHETEVELCGEGADGPRHRDTAASLRELLEEVERLRADLQIAANAMNIGRRFIESGQVVDKDLHGHLTRHRDRALAALKETTHD